MKEANGDTDSSLTEHAAAQAFARAWNRLDPEPFLALLTEGARYASQWVFEELTSRQAIAEYLRGKMKTVRQFGVNDPNCRVRAELASDRSQRPCVAICQGEGSEITAVVVFVVKGNTIQRYDMCIPELVEVRRSGVYPI